VEEFTGKKVMGVIPYLQELGIPEEDSVTFKQQFSHRAPGATRAGATPRGPRASTDDTIHIAVIDLPHISNFTDLDPLRIEPDISMHVIRSEGDLQAIPDPDIIIIPGSKNVIGDLKRIQAAGLTGYLSHCARELGTEIVGICGGFQMLGRTIEDPHRLESEESRTDGMGLLDIETVLEEQKILAQTQSIHHEAGCTVTGYEIHHGKTTTGSCTPLLTKPDGEVVGIRHPRLPVWGTYLHGIFDNDDFRHWFLDSAREKKGSSPVKSRPLYDLEDAFDTLADAVRQSVDLSPIMRSMGL
jgi:cobyric acid synthase